MRALLRSPPIENYSFLVMVLSVRLTVWISQYKTRLLIFSKLKTLKVVHIGPVATPSMAVQYLDREPMAVISIPISKVDRHIPVGFVVITLLPAFNSSFTRLLKNSWVKVGNWFDFGSALTIRVSKDIGREAFNAEYSKSKSLLTAMGLSTPKRLDK